MKCPQCLYEHGLREDGDTIAEGELGPFFCDPQVLSRVHEGHVQQRSVFGCPKCGRVFIDPSGYET